MKTMQNRDRKTKATIRNNEDLWDEAYGNLVRKEPRLVHKYGKALAGTRTDLKVSDNCTTNFDLGEDALQRERDYRAITKDLLDRFEKDPQLSKSQDDAAQRRLYTAAKVVVAAKEFISSVVDQEPHAAVAWAGICMLLPLFMNPLEQSKACQQGLEAIPFILRRFDIMENAVRPRSHGGPSYGEPSHLKASQDFESHTVSLNEKILEFLIRVALQSSRPRASRYGRDVFKFDNWASLLQEINDLDFQCTRLARQITMDRIDQGVARSNEMLEMQSRSWQASFDIIEQRLENNSDAIGEHVKDQNAWRQDDERRACHQALRLSPPYEDEKDRVPLRALDTCAWFLDHETFLSWKNSTNAEALWVSAKPGSGKSVLAKSLIEEGLLRNTPETVVTYFFFKDASPTQKKISSAVAGVLHQLFLHRPQLIQYALAEYSNNGPKLPEVFSVLWAILEAAAEDSAAGDIVCVLDGLDECDQSELPLLTEKIQGFLQKCQQNNKARLKFIMTGRPYSYIRSNLVQVVNLDADIESESIRQEIDQVIRQDVGKLVAEKEFSVEMRDLIVERLLEMDNRTYLWLKLVISEIRHRDDIQNSRHLSRALTELPTSINQAYGKILDRSPNYGIARQILHIVLAAQQPLSLDEMQVAITLARDSGYTSFEEMGLSSTKSFGMRLRNMCGLFISIDNDKVSFIHQTAREYLIQTVDKWSEQGHWQHTFAMQESHAIMARSCISLLRLDDFDSQPFSDIIVNTTKRTSDNPDNSDPDKTDPNENNAEEDDSDNCNSNDRGPNDRDPDDGGSDSRDPDNKVNAEIQRGQVWKNAVGRYVSMYSFLQYSATFWTFHYKHKERSSDQESITDLFDSNSARFQTWYGIYRIDDFALPVLVSGLIACLYLELDDVFLPLLQEGADVNEKHSDGMTALIYAINYSNTYTRLLLEHGADPSPGHPVIARRHQLDEDNIFMFPFHSPLSKAISGEHFDLADLLLKHGADIDKDLGVLGHPLIFSYIADGQGLFEGDDDEDDDDDYRNENDRLEGLQYLIDRGADLSRRYLGFTPLHAAANMGGFRILRILLRQDSEKLVNDIVVDDALRVQHFRELNPESKEPTSEILDDGTICPSYTYPEPGDTALHIVSGNFGGLIGTRVSRDGSARHVQISESTEAYLRCAQLLLKHGADPNIKSHHSGRTPLAQLHYMFLNPDPLHGEIDESPDSTKLKPMVGLLESYGAHE